MKSRITVPLFIAAVLTVTAFSTGSPVFLAGALLILMVIGLSWASVQWASRTMTMGVELSDRNVRRGENVRMTLTVRHDGWLPIAPVELELDATPDTPETVVRLLDAPGRRQMLTLPFHAAHVGVSRPGIRSCRVEDLFGLFSKTWTPTAMKGELLVMPLNFEVTELTFAPGDPGLGTMARATEDITSPSDVRPYQPGDPMKKIHWKLSVRKNELMVRKFEEPILPDAMVLMDCSRPAQHQNPEAEADVRDALLETAASIMASQMRSDHNIRMLLTGKHPVEVGKGMGMPLVLENLARVDFSETERFERVLTLEMRRLRQVGAVVVITSRLSGDIVEVMTQMRRLGPVVRLYYISFAPDDPSILPFIAQLQQATVEVNYVTPMRV